MLVVDPAHRHRFCWCQRTIHAQGVKLLHLSAVGEVPAGARRKADMVVSKCQGALPNTGHAATYGVFILRWRQTMWESLQAKYARCWDPGQFARCQRHAGFKLPYTLSPKMANHSYPSSA
jgi:hypothetical protein